MLITPFLEKHADIIALQRTRPAMNPDQAAPIFQP
jgi:hypothetical protein